MRAAFLLPALLSSFAAAARPLANPNATRYDAIVPGAYWRDTDGVLIQAHGGAMVRTDDGTFYWFGEDHRPGGTHFTGIAVYSSKDLYNWKNEGLAFKPVEGTPAASDQVGERPKVVYSEQTKQWVLYFHSDNPSYSLHYQAIGLSPNVTGPQDLGMYVDDDSTNLEAPGMFKENGTYYHVFSQKTGYRPNNAQLFTAPALTGPWTRQPQLAPDGTNTWESQNTFELKIKGTKKTTHIFMGDRWDRDELSDSRYMWLPITIGGKQAASLEWHDLWRIDVNTGEVTYPKGTSYEAEKGVIVGSANVTSCPTCSGGSYVTGITSNSSVTITNIKGTGKPQWLAIYYVNTDVQTTALHRYASVSVNGAAAEVVKQRTTAEGVVVSVPLQVQFANGSKNNVTISGASGRRESYIQLELAVSYASVNSRKRMVG
ncbi:hypothetical protein BN14_07142 [Rhizoctonia solani AG-1 IB]|uniref:Uncharacterized protein n=1 Tax=Thanatephorus cucumeris (strain AG1-IB / isolate 7/3/14) TaxID=1108050 RepID=M5BZI9_THACB|nr:hypothetical protein BN14_07142 [Rhizoctonia solani AG-1 IB]